MNAQITFNLPEEATDLQLALDAGKWRSVTASLDQWLRDKKKYEDQNQIDIGEVRNYLGELMQRENLNFD
jgi:hypothetical protein